MPRLGAWLCRKTLGNGIDVLANAILRLAEEI